MNADVEKAVEVAKWPPLWLRQPARQCCPACRGYRLERQWCDLCKGHGYITAHLGDDHE